MNSKHFDPDLKINMSLDEIIQLTRSDLLAKLRGRYLRGFKRKRNRNRQGNLLTSENSVPVMPSLGGGYIYVSKGNPLLNAGNIIRSAVKVSNQVNSDLIEKTKDIIPASYKLVRTSTGVKRILVPVEEYITDAWRKEFMANFLFHRPSNGNSSVQTPLTKTLNHNRWGNLVTNNQPFKMEIDESDNEVVILDEANGKQNKEEPLVINIESNYQTDSFKLGITSIVPQKPVTKTLNDRFTLLTSGTHL